MEEWRSKVAADSPFSSSSSGLALTNGAASAPQLYMRRRNTSATGGVLRRAAGNANYETDKRLKKNKKKTRAIFKQVRSVQMIMETKLKSTTIRNNREASFSIS